LFTQVAKAELAKVRQQRAFELQTVNIQDPGQEKWKRKYVYWIPALHIDDKEVAKGRWDAQTVNKALDEWQNTHISAPVKEDASA
jgi:zinc finger CCHC domain-containing protein 8